MAEKVIELSEVQNEQQTNESKTIETKQTEHKFVDKKTIASLTDDERALIINNFKNGVDQPHFTCKTFKNGNFRIIKRKDKPATLSSTIISQNESNQSQSKNKTYTNEQIMFEHIMDLNSKFDRLMSKHKKLKRKYDALQSDIYVDDDEQIVNEQIPNKVVNEPVVNEPVQNKVVDEPVQNEPQQLNRSMTFPQRPVVKNNWLSKIRYL